MTQDMVNGLFQNCSMRWVVPAKTGQKCVETKIICHEQSDGDILPAGLWLCKLVQIQEVSGNKLDSSSHFCSEQLAIILQAAGIVLLLLGKLHVLVGH